MLYSVRKVVGCEPHQLLPGGVRMMLVDLGAQLSCRRSSLDSEAQMGIECDAEDGRSVVGPILDPR